MPDVRGEIDVVKGFNVAGVHAGLKSDDRLDFAMIVSEYPCVTAGLFTTNKVKAAPILFNSKQLKQAHSRIKAVVINTVSANACTGQAGYENACRMAQLVADEIECESDQVLVMSTGVIGTQLPMDTIANGVKLAGQHLGDHWHDTATAIMTTDTRPKMASISIATSQGSYQIAGISKGAGMIAPNMATMLGVLVTDAMLDVSTTQNAVSSATDISYNRIVVDGDMSTNDMVVLMANGASGITLQTDDELQVFQQALDAICVKLAQDVVRDGEGVSKFITLHILGAEDDEAARVIGHTIATSPLVKTAFYGCDANWGRIVAAAGRANAVFNPDCAQLVISPGETAIDGLLIFANGTPTDYLEDHANMVMAEASIYVTLDCGLGNGAAIIWTCDLSHDYVTINGHYRT